MRDLPRLPEGASADEKIRIIYDWLYDWSKSNMMAGNSNPSVGQADTSLYTREAVSEGVMADADVTSGEE